MARSRITLEDGAYLELYEGFLSSAETPALFAALMNEVPFAQRAIRIYGREVMQPRLVAWVGEPEAVYTYSGTLHVPSSFGATLLALRERVAEACAAPFNSVLCNLYRNGQDAMGMHSDKEPELGSDPIIASLSLGASRRFVLRHRSAPSGPRVKEGGANQHPPVDLVLNDGSLLVMRGTTQSVYRHGLPRERAVTEPRINLTFRHTDASLRRS